MKLSSVIVSSFLGIWAVNGFAACCYVAPCHRIALQGSIATGGNLGIGIVDYTEYTELGATIAGQISSRQTNTVTPVIFAGLRKNLGELTYFAYGLNVASTFGRDAGVSINASYQAAPYISLEHMMTCHLMVSGWIQPYQYSYEKTGGNSVTTNSFFSTGGLALSYLF